MISLRSRDKIAETPKRIFANVKPILRSFVGQIEPNVIFPLKFWEKYLEKIEKNLKISNFSLLLFELFCAFQTLTINLVHFYEIITAKNVGTTIRYGQYP